MSLFGRCYAAVSSQYDVSEWASRTEARDKTEDMDCMGDIPFDNVEDAAEGA